MGKFALFHKMAYFYNFEDTKQRQIFLKNWIVCKQALSKCHVDAVFPFYLLAVFVNTKQLVGKKHFYCLILS